MEPVILQEREWDDPYAMQSKEQLEAKAADWTLTKREE